MGGFSMNKVLDTIKKRPNFGSGAARDTPVDLENDTPEVIADRCVRQFCQSVGSATGDDVTFLPSIVEAAVASPAAAAGCARLIRKFMNTEYWSKPSCQYNAIMLARILADNPGPTFTRNMDKKFVDTTKELLRTGRDPSVRQILMETLDAFENQKASDEGLALIIEMWRKEKEKAYRAYGGVPPGHSSRTMTAPPFDPYLGQRQGYHPPPHRSNRLPDPVELANRLEEARSSAKLLEQVVACTPSSEVLSNDLIKEFADRCSTALRSVQAYMAADDPAPDNDTMESLIDTNEQLQQALNQHHRAVLQARKQLGIGQNTSNSTSSSSSSSATPPPSLPPSHTRPTPALPPRKPVAAAAATDKGKSHLDTYNPFSSPAAGPSQPSHDYSSYGYNRNGYDDDSQNPFRDPPQIGTAVTTSMSGAGGSRGPQQMSFEPFHPSFGGVGSGSGSGRNGTSGIGTGTGLGTGAGTGVAWRDPANPVSGSGTDVYGSSPRGEYAAHRY